MNLFRRSRMARAARLAETWSPEQLESLSRPRAQYKTITVAPVMKWGLLRGMHFVGTPVEWMTDAINAEAAQGWKLVAVNGATITLERAA
jgi:hypothetical protein